MLAESTDLLACDADIGVEHNACLDPLAPCVIGKTVNGGFLDAGHCHDDIRYLCRMDVLSTGDYHVVTAAGDVQISVFVDKSHVVRMIPAAAEHIFGKLRLAEIALHLARTLDEYFTDYAGGALVVVLVGYHHLCARNRTADAVKMGTVVGEVVLGNESSDYTAHFGHAVGLIEIAVELFHRTVQCCRWDGAGGVTHDTQLTEVVAVLVSLVEYPFENGRNDAYCGDALAYKALHIGRRVKSVHEDERAAGA